MKSVHATTNDTTNALVPAPLRDGFAAFAAGLDLDPVIYKLIKEKHWSFDRARMAERDYKAFLYLIGQGHHLVPTFDIDEMWHMHILDTEKYMEDCARHFGEYIHHYPFMGLEDEADADRAQAVFAWTRALLAATVGDAPDLQASDCGGGCGSSCGGGSSCSGGSSCGTGGDSGGGHSSCGGHGGHDAPSDTPAPAPTDGGTSIWPTLWPIISSCSSGDSGTSRQDKPAPRRREGPWGPRPDEEPGRPAKRKPGIIGRILGLTPDAADRWYASVTPGQGKRRYRPDKKEVERLVKARLN